MNKKADTVFTVIFYIILFFIVFFLFGAKWMSENTASAIQINNLTGIEAFLMANIPLIFILIAILGFLAWMYLGK